MEIEGIYCIEGILDEDNNLHTWISKIQSIGSKEVIKFGWIRIDAGISQGIGTSTNNWGEETIEKAIISKLNYVDIENPFKFIITNDFDKVINCRNKIIELLKQKETKK